MEKKLSWTVIYGQEISLLFIEIQDFIKWRKNCLKPYWDGNFDIFIGHMMFECKGISNIQM